GPESGEVVLGLARLRMVLGIRRDLDVEPVARLLADEAHEVRGVAQLARHREAGGKVAAQRDDVADAARAVFPDHLAQALATGGDAGDVRRGVLALGDDLERRGERALARGAARAVRDGEERGRELRELLPRRAQLLHAFGRLRREELEAELALRRFGHAHACRAARSVRSNTVPAFISSDTYPT